MPGSEGSGELFFGHLVQGAGKPAQLLRRLALRPAGEILRNRLHLVELAELHRDVLALKNPCHASPAVDDGCGNGPAALQESREALGVHRCRLLLDFGPAQIPLQRRRAKHAHAIGAAKERSVGEDDGCLRRKRRKVWRCRIELCLHPAQALLLALGEFCQGLAFEDVLLVEISLFRFRTPS